MAVGNGRGDGARTRAQYRLAQEIADTRQRALIGGLFYLAGWLVVGGFGGAFVRHPVLATLLALAFAALAFARHVVRPPPEPLHGRRWLAWNWSVVLATATLWGGVTVWVHLDPGFDPAHAAALVCTVAYSTAVAHTYAMRPPVAIAAIALLFLPSVVLHWFARTDFPVAVALTIYLAYLMLALARSRRDYDSRLELDWQLREQRDSYERLSRIDPLTSIPNRRSFQDELQRAAEHARLEEGRLSLLMLDLDHFKYVNDRHGHIVGDDCLVAFARELERAFGDGFVARLGGEEFAVLLEEEGASARTRADEFRAWLATRPIQLAERQVAMTVSIGVGEYGAARAQNIDEFVRNVDRALYRAKTEGRDRVCDAQAAALTH